MYYFIDVDNKNETTERHIIIINNDGSQSSFLGTGDTPHALVYRQWLAEGNEPEEWTDVN